MSNYLFYVRPFICRECKGEEIVEHIAEGITEPCEHCSGTGRWETWNQEHAPSQIKIGFNNWLKNNKS